MGRRSRRAGRTSSRRRPTPSSAWPQFAELLDTAIANADSRDQLTASRARLVDRGGRGPAARGARPARRRAAAARAHDRDAQARPAGAPAQRTRDAAALVGEALGHAERSNAELRELAHGILPAVLTRGGLRAGVDAVVARLRPARSRSTCRRERFPADDRGERVLHRRRGAHQRRQACARHSAPRSRAPFTTRMLRLEIRDDGIGGADPDGHGLVGMSDRVTALGGRLRIESPAGGGTLVAASLPL